MSPLLPTLPLLSSLWCFSTSVKGEVSSLAGQNTVLKCDSVCVRCVYLCVCDCMIKYTSVSMFVCVCPCLVCDTVCVGHPRLIPYCVCVCVCVCPCFFPS